MAETIGGVLRPWTPSAPAETSISNSSGNGCVVSRYPGEEVGMGWTFGLEVAGMGWAFGRDGAAPDRRRYRPSCRRKGIYLCCCLTSWL